MSHASTPLSARELHETPLWKAHRLGNVVRRKFLRALAAMNDCRLYLSLGFPSIVGYADRHFGLSRSQTFEYLRVEAALASLPLLAQAYSAGQISWSALRELTRVATAETEAEWLRFAAEHNWAELRAETRNAVEKKRDRPRRGSYGLPNLTVELRLELSPEEHELVSKALAKVARELGSSLGERPGDEGGVDAKAALLYLAERVLESEPEETLSERVERKDSPYTVLYHQCRDCRRSALSTREGLVEIDAEVVARVAGEAEAVSISPEEELASHVVAGGTPRAVAPEERDRPNTPQLARKVFLRDGRTCSNPYCARTLGLHAHHIEFRAQGGRTKLANETLVCAACHALIHQGKLRLEGNPLDGVRFLPCGPVDGRSKELEDFERALDELAALEGVPSAPAEHSTSPAAESTRVDSERRENLREALCAVGYSRREAERRLAAALARLEDAPSPSDETILAAALANRHAAASAAPGPVG